MDGDSVELEYFWGAVESVLLEQVTLFRDYLDSRERVLSFSPGQGEITRCLQTYGDG